MKDACQFFLCMAFAGLIATLFNPWCAVATGLFIILAGFAVNDIDTAPSGK